MKKILLFAAGGAAYVGLEFAWRGRSHYSMFLAGGVCFLLLGALGKGMKRLSAPLRALAGVGVITAVELFFGLLFNRDFSVWDYRRVPYNFMGQICLLYSMLWLPISLFAMGLYAKLERFLTHNME